MDCIYFNNYTDDLVQSARQSVSLPADYRFLRRGFWNLLLDRLLFALLFVVAVVYVYGVLGVRFHGRKRLRASPQAFFLYANHTQAVGDPFIALLACFGRRAYGLVSTANYGIPLLGRLMPWMGALPVLPDREGRMRLDEAVQAHIRMGHPVVIYPEAHVWNYYTGIRPFSAAAFAYPVLLQVPAFTMTTVYTRRHPFGNLPLIRKAEHLIPSRLRRHSRPRMDVYIDGPFFPVPALPPREQRIRLCEDIRQSLCRRAAQSNYNYITYIRLSDY
ncbi:MAG: 1-acyl-sn-glycerol-3-phosphate acyltransferase [Paludibacteraceae bacterium]